MVSWEEKKSSIMTSFTSCPTTNAHTFSFAELPVDQSAEALRHIQFIPMADADTKPYTDIV